MRLAKNILICLDTSDINHSIMKFTRFITDTALDLENIYVVSVLRKFNIPEEVRKEYPELEKNAIAEREQIVNDLIKKYLSDKTQFNIETIVKVGRGLKTILKVVQDYHIDVAIVGRKSVESGTGTLPQRMGRRCPCHLLIVPDGSEQLIEKGKKYVVQVATDFSEHSTIALERAIQVASNYENTKVVCQHVYTIPSGYHYTGKSVTEFDKIMIKNLQKDFDNWLKPIDMKGLPIEIVFSRADHSDHVKEIHKLAEKIEPAGIVFGSKGITSAASFFLGSTSEKLIKIDSKFPLLVIRKPGEHKRLLDAIKKL